MVVMDAGTLLLLFRPNVDAPLDPSTGKPVQFVQERISFLVKTLEKAKTKIAIPTPALSEMLVRAGSAAPALLQQISRYAVFQIVPFDTLAAVEVAAMTHDAIGKGDKRGGVIAPWAKVKYDRQIVAIAKVIQASAIYSDDDGVETFGMVAGIPVIRVATLPLPPSDAQGKLPFVLPEDRSSDPESAISDEEIAEANAELDEQESVSGESEEDEPAKP